MPQLVGIADDIDRGNPIAVDRHAQRMIEFAIEIEQGADGAVDHGGLNADLVTGILAGEADEEAGDPVGAMNRIACGSLAATAIGDRNRVFAQQFSQPRHVAAGHRCSESQQQAGVTIRRRRGRGGFVAHRAVILTHFSDVLSRGSQTGRVTAIAVYRAMEKASHDPTSPMPNVGRERTPKDVPNGRDTI